MNTNTALTAAVIDRQSSLVVPTPILLIAGAAAGPIFAAVATAQVLFRDGFDLRRHPLSQLATGDLGFVQIANFIVAGIGVLCLAIGVRRTATDGVGRRSLTPLIAVFGLGLIASGVFVMDPENGFPLGTPDGPAAVKSRHGFAHLVAATVAFTGLAAASIVLTVRLARHRDVLAALVNAGVALIFLAPVHPAWMSIQVAINALIAFTWTTVVAVSLLRSDQDH